MSQSATPVLSNERSGILDVLRGFALFGICIVNYYSFSLYVFQSPDQRSSLSTSAVDQVLKFLETALFEGKFYSLFSLLFGIGFSIILLRNQHAGRNPLPVFYRRLFVLALFGFAHAFLLWDGDILLLYALIGMFLPLFRKASDKTLLTVWVILIFLPIVFDTIKVISHGRLNISTWLRVRGMNTDKLIGVTDANISNWLIVNDDYKSVLKWDYSGFFWRWQGLLDSNRIPKVLGMFLLGLYVGRNMIYARLEENRGLLKKVQRWGFIIGIPATAAYTYFVFDKYWLPHIQGLLDTLFYALSVVPLSLAYASSICLLWLKPSWNKRLQVLAPAGRMALTNYLMQSALGVILFYGVGFGIGAKLGPSLFMPISLGVIILQVLLSRAWLTYFQFGPFEWIWRQLTYGQKLPILKKQ